MSINLPQDEIDFESFRNTKIELVLLELRLLFTLRPEGAELRGLCPLCEGEGKLFRVDTFKDAFDCAECGEKGDVVDFVTKFYEKLPKAPHAEWM